MANAILKGMVCPTYRQEVWQAELASSWELQPFCHTYHTFLYKVKDIEIINN
jgi:hypothetical protein